MYVPAPRRQGQVSGREIIARWVSLPAVVPTPTLSASGIAGHGNPYSRMIYHSGEAWNVRRSTPFSWVAGGCEPWRLCRGFLCARVVRLVRTLKPSSLPQANFLGATEPRAARPMSEGRLMVQVARRHGNHSRGLGAEGSIGRFQAS
jgi:hypothetical protein